MELEQSRPQETELKEPIKEKTSPSGFTLIEGEIEKPLPEPDTIVEPPSPVAILDGRVVQAIAKVDGKFVFNEAEKELYIKLSKSKVAEVEELTPVKMSVTDGVTYQSVDEALKHIDEETPESLVIPYLKEQLNNTEQWLSAALTKLDEAEQTIAKLTTVDMVDIKSRVDTVETKVNTLEAKQEPIKK